MPSGIRINFKATQKGQLQPRLESITEPLRGILGTPINIIKLSNKGRLQGSLVRAAGFCGAGLAGEAGMGEIVPNAALSHDVLGRVKTIVRQK